MKSALSPSALRVLGVLLQEGRAMTLRGVSDKLGWAFSGGKMRYVVGELEDAGLVSREMFAARTLRAQCRFIPASEL